MSEKRTRKLKVYAQSGYRYKDTPTIILKGEWLRKCGFEIGDNLTVDSASDGVLTVRVKHHVEKHDFPNKVGVGT